MILVLKSVSIISLLVLPIKRGKRYTPFTKKKNKPTAFAFLDMGSLLSIELLYSKDEWRKRRYLKRGKMTFLYMILTSLFEFDDFIS
jgi:hypothetical protein